MKAIAICDSEDALGFALAGIEVAAGPAADDDAVYIVSASRAYVLPRLPRNAPVVVLPCRDTAARNR